mmetsp:Transcript_4161/g.14565  ORF Transcript_4161/g.14565 Transcript_4161/m.14565 type:complete len:224 (-) Transcript_4161:42-713(-)
MTLRLNMWPRPMMRSTSSRKPRVARPPTWFTLMSTAMPLTMHFITFTSALTTCMSRTTNSPSGPSVPPPLSSTFCTFSGHGASPASEGEEPMTTTSRSPPGRNVLRGTLPNMDTRQGSSKHRSSTLESSPKRAWRRDIDGAVGMIAARRASVWRASRRAGALLPPPGPASAAPPARGSRPSPPWCVSPPGGAGGFPAAPPVAARSVSTTASGVAIAQHACRPR